MKREIFKVFDVSTIHVTPEDCRILDDMPTIANDDYGYFLWSGLLQALAGNLGDANPALRAFSEGFRNLFKVARENGCRYIRLDRDGPEYDDLQKYDW